MASIFGRAIIVTKTNKSGGSLAKGDVVVIDASNDNAVTTTTTSGTTVTVGVVVEENGIANNNSGRVQFGGHVSLVTVNASVTRGHYGTTHTVAKQATDGGASRVVGTFCLFTTGGTTPEADLFSQPDASSATGNMATDALWDNKGDSAWGTGANMGAKLAAAGNNAMIVRSDSSQTTGARWTNFSVPALARLTSGDVTISATSAGTGITGVSDLTIAAASGDTLMIGFSTRCPNTTAVALKLDVATIVSAAVVNYISSLSSTAATNGVSAWLIAASESNTASGAIPYIVQSGDISGGNVVLRAICHVASGTRAIAANTNSPLVFFAYNMGQ